MLWPKSSKMPDEIQRTIEFVQKSLAENDSSHDWWHIERVLKLARRIASTEGDANLQVVELAALLHDIADYKYHDGDELIGGKVAREWLDSQGVSPDVVEHVVEIIDHNSFKGEGNDHTKRTLEAKIVSDADKLDSMGAIGIARCFTFGGAKGRVIYDPNIKPKTNKTKQEYLADKPPSLNHFYEKLLLLQNIMQTAEGKRLAAGRHNYLQGFLDQFHAEWEGKA
jgi:uncharacterized protein